MYKHRLVDLVRNDAEFLFITDGKAYYQIIVDDTVYEFPIPINDIGNGTLNVEEKGILLMRWIRKAMESQEMRATSLVV